jgi:hypothetical protein
LGSPAGMGRDLMDFMGLTVVVDKNSQCLDVCMMLLRKGKIEDLMSRAGSVRRRNFRTARCAFRRLPRWLLWSRRDGARQSCCFIKNGSQRFAYQESMWCYAQFQAKFRGDLLL